MSLLGITCIISTGTMILVLLSICFILLGGMAVHSYITNRLKYKDFDGPSPFLSLPILGHTLLLNMSNPLVKLSELRKRHGEVFRCDIGNTPTIFICSYDLLAEAFKKDEFNDRPAIARSFLKSIKNIITHLNFTMQYILYKLQKTFLIFRCSKYYIYI